MTFPLMNLETDVRETGFHESDSVASIARRSNRIKSAIGLVQLMSDGRVQKGYDSDLITLKGWFNITEAGGPERFHWNAEDGASDPYFVDSSGNVVIGGPSEPYLLGPNGLLVGPQGEGYYSIAQLHSRPLFNKAEALYRWHSIPETKGIFGRDNVEGKIEFLEGFLDIKDKSGCAPRDMVVSDSSLRLKLLELHYVNNTHRYAVR